MDYFLLYLILKLDAISRTAFMLTIIAAILFIIALGLAILHNDKNICNSTKPWIKRMGILFVTFLFFTIMIPSTKQVAIIYCLPKVVNNEHVQKIPDNLLRLADKWINEQSDETVKTVTKIVE